MQDLPENFFESDIPAIVELEGEFDLVNAVALEKMLLEASETKTKVVIDLTGVTFMDSSALSAIFRVYRNSPKNRFTIVSPNGTGPRRVLELLGIDKVIPITENFSGFE